MKMYLVGGAVRDEIMGIAANDFDFTVVLDKDEEVGRGNPFMVMVFLLKKQGFKIFLESPEFLTVRAQFPNEAGVQGFDVKRTGLTADFVLARKESDYADGRRPDKVEVGTLEDDLARRDFTMNAIAKGTCSDCNGENWVKNELPCGTCGGTGTDYIDPFNGRVDIEAGIIRAVGDPMERLTEDALRAVRALRFSVTKGFKIDFELKIAMQSNEVLEAIRTKISDERIKDELSKMMRFDSLRSIRAMNDFGLLTEAMFSGAVSLDATMKTKGRGK